MNNIIALYCDGGGSKKVMLIDTHLNRFLFSRSPKSQYVGEYRAILFTLNYIKQTYVDRDIVILNDGKSEIDVLNGNSQHHREPTKSYALKVDDMLKTVRMNNIINLIWLPRKNNEAGRFLQRFYVEKQKFLIKKHNVEIVDFNTLEKRELKIN